MAKNQPNQHLYQVKKAELNPAVDTLVQAFTDDPYFKVIFGQINPSLDLICQYFKAIIKYAQCYGEIYADSEDLKGLAIWLPSDFQQFKMNDLFSCGVLFDILNLGVQPIQRLYYFVQENNLYIKQLPLPRKFSYLFYLGIKPQYQGQGLGRQLVSGFIKILDRKKMSCLLQTNIKRNTEFYLKFGFELAAHKQLKTQDLEIWYLVRKPQ